MSWDPVWEQLFRKRSWGKYPPEELVRFIFRSYPNPALRKTIKVLDLGCGPGSCSWFLAREGFLVSGIDGSQTAIQLAQERLQSENLKGDFKIGDFNKMPWSDSYFDAVIDIDSLTCNTAVASKQILKEIGRILKPNGLLFSMTFKNGCWGDESGIRIEPHTYQNVTQGPLGNMGITRFSTETEILELYGIFKDLNLEYSIRSVDNMKHEISQWIIICKT